MIDTFDCARAQVYYNTAKLSPAQIKAKTGCTHIINGYLFNGKFQPVGWTVIDGKIISRDAYQDWGISIGSDGLPKMLTDRGGSFLSGVPLLKAGAKLRRDLTPDVARPAARTAVGWMPNGKVCLWCDKASLTREQLQNKLLGLGVTDALMMHAGNLPWRQGDQLPEGAHAAVVLGAEGGYHKPYPGPSQSGGTGAGMGQGQGAVDGQQCGGDGDTGRDGSCIIQNEVMSMVGINGYSKAKDGNKRLSAHFKVKEFACRDGSDAVLVAPRLVMVLESIRNYFGSAVVINSGYRTPQYNAKVGGVTESQHCYGTAADISVEGQKPEQVAAYARQLMPDWGGVGIYSKQGFTHIDVRETKADWTG